MELPTGEVKRFLVFHALSFDVNIRSALRSDGLTQLAQSSIPRSRIFINRRDARTRRPRTERPPVSPRPLSDVNIGSAVGGRRPQSAFAQSSTPRSRLFTNRLMLGLAPDR